MNSLTWHRSTRYSSGGCVDVAATPDAVLVRDSKLDRSPILTFDRQVWKGFVAALRAGEMAS